MGRTAITVARTHKGDWQLLATPDDNLIEQKKNFHALRSSKAHKEFATVIYQESDGHALINRLLTPAAAKAIDDQNAKDHAEVAKFDKAQAQVKEKNPARAKAADEFKKNEEQAARIEGHAREKGIPVHEAAETLALENKTGDEGTTAGTSELEQSLAALSRSELLAKVEDWNAAHADNPIPIASLKGKQTIIAALIAAAAQ